MIEITFLDKQTSTTTIRSMLFLRDYQVDSSMSHIIHIISSQQRNAENSSWRIHFKKLIFHAFQDIGGEGWSSRVKRKLNVETLYYVFVSIDLNSRTKRSLERFEKFKIVYKMTATSYYHL